MILFQVGTVGSIALVPVAIAATGGSTSPLRALALLIIVYCAWFYDGKVAASALALVTRCTSCRSPTTRTPSPARASRSRSS